jgi:hypothetical protein
MLAAFAAVALGAGVTADAAPRPATLFPGRLIGTGEAPGAPVVADFNGDGVADLAVANWDSDDISIILGLGDGTFLGQTRVAAGPQPAFLAAGDFNGDGRVDLVVADAGDGTVRVLPGRGDGSFEPPLTSTGTDDPWALATGDLNGDGHADVVLADDDSRRVLVLLGRGDGSLMPPASFDPGFAPAAIALADLDRDGRLDLVVAGRFRVAVLSWSGDGTFTPRIQLAVPTDAISIVAADLGGDGVPDVVLGGRQPDPDRPTIPGVVVLRGSGDGGLSVLQALDAAGFPLLLEIADLDGDGHPDVVGTRIEADDEGRGTIAFYHGMGGGTLAAPLRSAAGYYPAGLATGDFDRDGRQDAVISNDGANCLSVLIGIGDGRFRPRAPAPASFAVGDAPMAIVAVDLDGDGRPDLATANDFSHDLSVLRSTGGGGFSIAATLPAGPFPQSLLAADLNGDSRPDLVTDDHLLFGEAGGQFEAGPALPAGYRPLAVTAGDINADGRTDLAIADAGDFGSLRGAVVVFLNLGFAGMFPIGRLEAGDAPVAVVMGDFDRDGRLDLVSADAYATDLRLFRGRGDGTFDPAVAIAAGVFARVLLAADLNHDGRPDLLASGFESSPGAGAVSVLQGDGHGGFAAPERLVAGASALGLAVGDLDADGRLDLVATTFEADTISILRNLGDGTFAPQETYFAGDAPDAVAIADLDGDGRNDLAVANDLIPGRVSLLFNTGPIPDRAPRPVPSAAAAVECTSPSGGEVLLDGRASTDPDSSPGTSDDIASFAWFESFGTPQERLLAGSALAAVTLPLGVHTLTLRVTDRAGASGTADLTVRVVDTRPPALSLRTSPPVLWPPNHQLRAIDIAAEATDACGGASVALVSVTSSEPDDAPGADDGSTVGDIAGADIGTADRAVSLRAERDGRGPGRTYTLLYRATDASGNSATTQATVLVPASRGAGDRPLTNPRRRGPKH